MGSAERQLDPPLGAHVHRGHHQQRAAGVVVVSLDHVHGQHLEVGRRASRGPAQDALQGLHSVQPDPRRALERDRHLRRRMVLQMRPDARPIDAGAQQHGRRVDGAGRQDDLAGLDLLATGQPDAGCPDAGVEHPVDQRLTPDGEVGPRAGRLQVRVVGGGSSPLHLVQRRLGQAIHAACLGAVMAERDGRVGEGVDEGRPPCGVDRSDRHGQAREPGTDVGPAPAGRSARGPPVVVRRGGRAGPAWR